MTNEPNAPYDGSVWPPPPTTQAAAPMSVPFRTLYRRVRGSVPNVRVGTLTLSEVGVHVQGKAVLPMEWQVPIMVVAWLINLAVRLVFLITYLVLQYAVRRDETFTLPWEQVREIVLVPKQRLACVVYEALNHRGMAKTYSLAFRLTEAQFQPFVNAAERFVPGRVGTGRLRGWTSPRTWIALGGLVLLFGYAAIVAAMGSR